MNSDNLVNTYKENKEVNLLHLAQSYIQDDILKTHMSATETGRAEISIFPVMSNNDVIFSELPEEIKQNVFINPFLRELFNVYSTNKKEEYTYLPLLVGHKDDENIVLDWIYETVRISFFFTKERDAYSITKYDPQSKSYYQKVETLSKDKYKDIATEVIQAIV